MTGTAKSKFLMSKIKRIQLFHEAVEAWTEVCRLWGTGAGNSINQSYHISHWRYPEPLLLAKRNAGSGYEIGSIASLISFPGLSV